MKGLCPRFFCLTAQLRNGLGKDLCAGEQLVNHRKLIRPVHPVVRLRHSRSKGNAVLQIMDVGAASRGLALSLLSRILLVNL